MHHQFHFHRGSGPSRGGSHRFERGLHEGQRRPHKGIRSHSELQSRLLTLLAESPRHGFEIVQQSGEASGESKELTPGLVYPALAYLEESGHATATREGTRTRYEITRSGRQHLELLLRNATTTDRGAQDSGELWLARHALTSILRDNKGASTTEQRRLVEILHRATAEIRSKPVTSA